MLPEGPYEDKKPTQASFFNKKAPLPTLRQRGFVLMCPAGACPYSGGRQLQLELFNQLLKLVSKMGK
ncbi:hypothetical protein HNR77_005550 [Paenibacillus sp. JGP012]|nr:hypothetical protein [Paenibacillus sp. JGP012]